MCRAPDAPLALEDVSLPPLGPRDVRVETGASGVCHTDLTAWRGLTQLPFPLVLGHEGAGTVTEVGSQVTRCAPGDRVIMSWAPQCGQCYYCIRGEGQHCDEAAHKFRHRPALADGTEVAGVGGIGTFAEEMQTSEIAVVPVRSDLPFEQLALIGCGVATGVGAALWTARVEPGSTVAVIGAGGVGLSVIQGAAIAGAARIIAIDPIESKRSQALTFGATETLDPAAGDVVAHVKERTGGRGVDYAFEVVGVPDLIRQAFDLVRPRGTAVVVGMPRHDATVTVPVLPLFKEEKRIVGSFYGSAQVLRDFPLLVQLAESGRLDLASMVSRRLTLTEATAAFDAMRAGEVIRSVLIPS